MKRRTRDYERDLIKQLRDPEFATEYLNVALDDHSSSAEQRFLIALRQVARAHGMSALARKTHLARPAMYRSLSKSGNPEFASLRSLLLAMGLKLSVETLHRGKRAA